MAFVLAIGMTPIVPRAYAADEDKPESVVMTIAGKDERPDVVKRVVTLDANMGKGITIAFDVKDKYSDVSTNDRRRRLVFEDSSGKQEQLSETSGNRVGVMSEQLVTGRKLKLITLTKDSSGNFVKRYEKQLNVEVVDTKKAEQKPAGEGSMSGVSNDGSSWSFSNGLNYTFKDTGFKFLDGTTINLGALRLPLYYKHQDDGTTLVGINCNPDDVAFYKAIKNGNVWQKYTGEEIAKKTSEMDKGWSGKKFGTWGGKSFDWSVCGYMEYNTKDPNAPRAVNLIISMGLKAEGHAQYLCFTGTLTFTVGGKAMLVGKLTPAKGVEGKLGLGAYAGLELYIGLGLQYVASVGAYGKGRIDIDFQVLPDFYLDNVKLSGDMGAKAKAFGFTLFTWTILKGEKILYSHKSDTKKMPDRNEDGTATSPFNVDADSVYPVDSSSYLSSGTNLMTAQSDDLTAQSSSSTVIQDKIYGQTELACATSSSGPVMVYVADARQIYDGSGRDDYNRSVVVYKRMKADGTWSEPRIIDAASDSDSKEYADYSPSITVDGDTCYVTWLAAKEKFDDKTTIGQLGQKLDVKVATISKGATINEDTITIDSVKRESDEAGTMPASPKAVKTNDGLYVGWYTNQASGTEGEVIGVSGTHNFRLYKKNGTSWSMVKESAGQSGAVTSFDVGSYGGTAACVWSLDPDFASTQSEVSLDDAMNIAGSSVYVLTPGTEGAKLVSQRATNAQFAKYTDSSGVTKDVLTYAIRGDENDSDSVPFLSIQSSYSLDGEEAIVLDGSKVNLPTPYYEIAGDLGKGRSGNISFLKAGDGTCDIQALVTTGAGSADWTSIMEATADSNIVTDYCATYSSNGTPLFIYATDSSSAATGGQLSSQAEDDGAVDLNQSTDQSLKHVSVTGLDYDEYEVDSGQKMPVTVHFENDGMLDVSGVDLYVLENGTAKIVAQSDKPLPMDEEGTLTFEYDVPGKDKFSKALDFTVYAAPKGAAVDAAKIKRELEDESAMNVSIGAASLALETEHLLVDGQETIVASVTNDGIVPHAAKMVFIDSDTGKTLKTVDVPELGENETYLYAYDATSGYFENDGIENIIVTLDDDGTEHEGYEINNTEFVSTWDQNPSSDQAAPAATTKGTSAKSPTTGDKTALAIILSLIALALFAGWVAMNARDLKRKEGE